MTVLLGKLHLPFQLPPAGGAPNAAAPSRFAVLARAWPRDPLVLALLAVAAALCVLLFVLRRALPARRRAQLSASGAQSGLTTPIALAFDAAQRPPSPPRSRSTSPPAPEKAPRIELVLDAPAPARRRLQLPTLDLKAWNVLARLVELFDLLEDDEPHVQIVEKPTAAMLPSAPLAAPPRRRSPPGHRRTNSIQGMEQVGGTPRPPPPARPLSAAKLIMSRHTARKPYRPPPVPGSPRSKPLSRLVGEAA